MSGTWRQSHDNTCTAASVSRLNKNTVNIFSHGVANPCRTAGTWAQGPRQADTWVEFDLPHDLFAYSSVHVHCCLSEHTCWKALMEKWYGNVIFLDILRQTFIDSHSETFLSHQSGNILLKIKHDSQISIIFFSAHIGAFAQCINKSCINMWSGFSIIPTLSFK